MALLVVGNAGAATVGLTGTTQKTLVYTAAPGESNYAELVSPNALPGPPTEDIIVRHPNGGTLTDADGPGGCVATAPQNFTCPGASVTQLSIDTGDMNDIVAIWPNVADVKATISGGSGDDILLGTPKADEISGGSGNDVIAGELPGQTIGDGDNLDGGTGADSMYGGPGKDAAIYSSRSSGVKVTLDNVANDGNAVEDDNPYTQGQSAGDSVATEDIEGGEGSDTLVGNGEVNTLLGWGGSDLLYGGDTPPGTPVGVYDVLNGGGDADGLIGGPGNTFYLGGAGADTMLETVFGGPSDIGGVNVYFAADDSNPALKDTIYCTPQGDDRVVANTFDIVVNQGSCESIALQ